MRLAGTAPRGPLKAAVRISEWYFKYRSILVDNCYLLITKHLNFIPGPNRPHFQAIRCQWSFSLDPGLTAPQGLPPSPGHSDGNTYEYDLSWLAVNFRTFVEVPSHTKRTLLFFCWTCLVISGYSYCNHNQQNNQFEAGTVINMYLVFVPGCWQKTSKTLGIF